MNRRQLLSLGALGTLGVSTLSASQEKEKKKAPNLRVAHVTDMHITWERDAPQGIEMLMKDIQADYGADFILNSGDSVMAIDGKVTAAEAAIQLRQWATSIGFLCRIPMYSCLGNHDFWDGAGPNDSMKEKDKGPGTMVSVLKMPNRYYSMNKGRWHFIFLDSQDDWPKGLGYLKEEQLEWLKKDLKATPPDMHVCVISHLPILSVTPQVYGNECKKLEGNLLPKSWVHQDCWVLTEIFRQHPNVKLCLSGHIHTCDRVEYRNVWYICGGAASGAWWEGSQFGFPPCYGQLDLYDNGQFEYRFIDYGWKAREWKGMKLG